MYPCIHTNTTERLVKRDYIFMKTSIWKFAKN